jgi:PAS domain S-box-containing protein
MSGVPALIFLLDAQDRFVDYRAGEELYAPPESFLGRRVDEVLPPPTGARLAEAIAEARRDGRPVRMEYALPFPEGERHFEARVRALPGGGVAALCTDVTAHRAAEERLRESEERFRALIENATDLLVVFDERGVITLASPAVSETLGWTLQEMLGRPGGDFIHPEDLPEAARVLAEVIRSPPRVVRATIRLRHKDGGWRVVETSLRSLLHVPAVRGVVSNGRDVTEQKQLEERFLQAQNLESVGRLAGGVAHDFNNLLVAILGYAAFLEEGIRAGNPSLEDLAEIRSAGERARDLTRQLLAVARRQVLDSRVMDLNGVLRDAEKLLRRVLGEDVALALVPAADLWRVKADPSQIQQVVLNLAVNARDAMPQGGKLTLETANVVLDERYAAEHPGVAPGPYALLAVSDSGVGMSREAKAHLFEPFFTTKPAGEGTGLGLATVYGIVRQAGGHVWVYSEPGQGTSFKIYLPRTEETEERPEPRRAVRDHRGSETVLVVEDEPAVRELASRALAAAGYHVLQAPSGREALEEAGRTAGPVHLLVTDVVMPDMSGQKLAEALKRARPETRVLYMSGYTENTIVHHGVLDAGVHFLSKPFTPATIQERVREVLDAG